MAGHILNASISGEECEQIIIRRLIPAITGIPQGKAMLAMLTFFITLSKPDISAELLTSTVKGASEFITMALTEVDAPPKEEMN